jgi:3-keto-L-gulonate-6-phosphate decarboxylase
MTPELVAAIITALLAVASWLKSKTEIDKIKADRLETKTSRDEAAQQMHDDLIRMQCKQTEFESNIKILVEQGIKHSNSISELSKQHAEVMVTLRNILETLKEMKDKRV